MIAIFMPYSERKRRYVISIKKNTNNTIPLLMRHRIMVGVISIFDLRLKVIFGVILVIVGLLERTERKGAAGAVIDNGLLYFRSF